MSVLDDLMVATQHLIGWEEGAAELARLRRMADAYAHWCVRDIENMGRCDCCGRARAHQPEHTATCDVAAHLGLPREKGEGE